MRLLALLLLAAPLAAVEPPFDKGAVAMYPVIEPDRREELRRACFGPLERANALRRQPGKSATEIEKIYADMEADLAKRGFDVDRLKRMPRGVLRVEQYNHGVVLEAPDLTDRQRELLARAVASVDAAQEALLAQQRHLQKSLENEDATLQRLVRSGLERQRNEIERRFWKVVYYALRPGQMRAVRKLFSTRYRAISQLREQIYQLPGMTPSQASRVRALFAEAESEAAADRALVQQSSVRLRDRALPEGERKALQARQKEAQQRLAAMQWDMVQALLALLGEEQQDALKAIPPMLNVGEKSLPPGRLLGGMTLVEAQKHALEKLTKEAQQEIKSIQREMYPEYSEMQKGGLGPESPQMMTMEMMQRGARGQVCDLWRESGRSFVLEVLEPGQIVSWMVAPDQYEGKDK